MIDCLGPAPPPKPWYVRLWGWFFPVKIPSFTTFTMPMIKGRFPSIDFKGMVERREEEAKKLADSIIFETFKKS